jgi:hypothetical protein
MAVLFLAHVYKSWVDQRDSGNRVTTLDHSPQYKRSFVLNPLKISDLLTHTKGSTFKFSDNFGDRRERYSNIICDKTVAEIKAILDTAPFSNAITLPIHPNNNPEKTPVNTTIQWAQICYADRYNPDPENHCWVIYNLGSFKRVEVLCNLAIEDVVDLVRYGSTSSTFSSVSDYFHQL